MRVLRKYLHNDSNSYLAFLTPVLVAVVTSFLDRSDKMSVTDAVLMIALSVVYTLIGMRWFLDEKVKNTPGRVFLYFLIQIPLGNAIMFFSHYLGAFWLVLLPVAASGVVVLAFPWMMLVSSLVLVSMVIPLTIHFNRWDLLVQNTLAFATAILFVIIFTRVAVQAQTNQEKVEKLAAELQEANAKLREYASQAEELATAKERNRLAREIHDSLGHYLTVANVQMEAARALLETNPANAMKALDKAQTLTREGLAEVRKSVAALRASPLDGKSLPEAIEQLAEESRNSGIITDYKVCGNPRPLSEQVTLTLYRAAQEGLTNVRKHSGASEVSLTLDYNRGKEVRLMVKDNGRGQDGNGQGFGLMGINERLQLLGGQALINSAPGEGFTLEVIIPGE